MKEKRKYKRKLIKLNVEYDMSTDQKWLQSETRDIGGGGICLITHSPIEIGKTFYEQKLKPERFKLNLEYTCVSDARFAISDVKIIGNKVVVTHSKMNGEKIEETFSSRFLQ